MYFHYFYHSDKLFVDFTDKPFEISEYSEKPFVCSKSVWWWDLLYLSRGWPKSIL